MLRSSFFRLVLNDFYQFKPQLQNFIFISLINYLLKVIVDKLAVANAEGCLNACYRTDCISFLFHSFTIF